MRMLRRRLPLLILAAAIGLAGPAAAAGPQEIKVALSWLRNGQYTALMVADAKGFFKEEGLTVRFIDGGPGKNPVPIVGAGQADFGIAGAASIFLARLAPSPVDIVAIGAVTQTMPYAYIRLAAPGTPAPTPKDLEGTTVGMQSDGDIFLKALAERNGIDLGKIRTQTVMATAEPLLVGSVDWFTGMLHNQTYQIEQEIAKAAPDSPLYGKIWQAVRFNDHGVRSYHDVLFASSSTVRERPDLVRRLMRAVARGLAATIVSPTEAVALVDAYPEQIERADRLTWRLAVQNPLAVSDDTRSHGLLWMDPAVWDGLLAFYHTYGQIPRVVPAADVMTNDFNAKIVSP